jgi:hypothetical protein
MDTGKLAIGMTAAAFLGFGTISMFKPEVLRKVGVRATNATGRTELRAMYGGMELGFGVFFAMAARRPDWRRPALTAIACAVGALGVTRIATSIAEGADPMSYALAGPEIAASSLAVVALAGEGRRR